MTQSITQQMSLKKDTKLSQEMWPGFSFYYRESEVSLMNEWLKCIQERVVEKKQLRYIGNCDEDEILDFVLNTMVTDPAITKLNQNTYDLLSESHFYPTTKVGVKIYDEQLKLLHIARYHVEGLTASPGIVGIEQFLKEKGYWSDFHKKEKKKSRERKLQDHYEN